MALFNKPTAGTAQPVRQQLLQVSPYENPEVTLELVGKITSAPSQSDINLFWEAYHSTWEKTHNDLPPFEKIHEISNLLNPRFQENINKQVREVSDYLEEHHDSHHTKIILAGGFSSGKSSFLNRLIKVDNLLPTGTQPFLVVKTYLYCDKNTRELSVQGVNQNDILVTLEPSVLQAIQHANESNVHLAAVLDKLLVRIPSNELDGLAFIDTPGYNNSDRPNKSNQKTDRETALEAFEEGNVLFWLIDSDKGTTVTEDLEMIAQFDGQKVIIFNKADKKGEKESRNIVEAAYQEVAKHLDMDEVIDIMAYSALDNKVVYSRNYRNLDQLLKDVRIDDNQAMYEFEKEWIEYLFDDEITASKNTVSNYEQNYSEATTEKGEAFKNLKERQKEIKDIKKNVGLLFDSYINLSNSVTSLCDIYIGLHNKVDEIAVAIIESNNDKWNTHDDINEKCQKLIDYTDYRGKKYNSIDKRSFDLDWVSDVKAYVLDLIEETKNGAENRYNQAQERTTQLKESLAREQQLYDVLTRYKERFVVSIEAGIKNYLKHSKATAVAIQSPRTNVFDAIERRDYKGFLRSFENGVELSQCNSAGFTPLTYAVHFGNMAMVQFLLANNADCAGIDKRGYNALHTALQVGAKGIAEMLIQHDSMLKTVPAMPSGQTQTIQDIIARRDFQAWAEKEFAS